MFKKMILNMNKILIFGIILLFGISINGYTYPEKDLDIDKKADIVLQNAHEDLMNSFSNMQLQGSNNILNTENIDFSDLKTIDYNEIMKLDKEIIMEFSELEDSPIGSIYPIFLKNDENTVIAVLYKEHDGTNVARFSEYVNHRWIRSEITEQGSPILDINDIDI